MSTLDNINSPAFILFMDGAIPEETRMAWINNARTELAALRRRAEDAEKVLEAERAALWINFHTPAAQKAADEMLTRIKNAILKDEKGS